MDGLTGIGEHDAVVEPGEQLALEEALEVPHLLADGRWAHIQFGSRCHIASGAGSYLKVFQSVKGRKLQHGVHLAKNFKARLTF